LKNERGNAIVEFVAIGLLAQLAIFAFMIRLGSDFRSGLAAETIARQTLRSFQLTGQQAAALEMANLVYTVFGLTRENPPVEIRDNCANSGLVEIVVNIRGKIQSAKGFC
jgi:hypothetical protein